MLLPGGPFHFVGSISVPVKDPKAAARWYGVVLNLNCVAGWDLVPVGMTDNMDRSNPGPQIVFVNTPDGPLSPTGTKRPIIFTRDVENAHRWFSAQTSTTDPIHRDSGGNQFFTFRDLDGNQIEVCLDPEIAARGSGAHS
jgi:catechol 2,3-dioxygenase-like lactoylglutathione lyase family enzyme